MEIFNPIPPGRERLLIKNGKLMLLLKNFQLNTEVVYGISGYCGCVASG